MYRVVFFLKRLLLLHPQFVLDQRIATIFSSPFCYKTWRKKKSFQRRCPSKQSICRPLLTTFTLLPFISGVVTCLFIKKHDAIYHLYIFFVQLLRYFFRSIPRLIFCFSAGSDYLQDHEPLKNAIIIYSWTWESRQVHWLSFFHCIIIPAY